MTIIKHPGVITLLAAVLAGCQPPSLPEQEQLSESGAALIGGVATNARPEIGWLSTGSVGCTATLIAPQWVLTAGHCTGYTTTPPPGTSFEVTYGLDGLSHSYSVDQIHVFGNGSSFLPNSTIGNNDIAILHLSSAVPASVAVPAQLAGTQPSDGTQVTMFGYGCQNRGDPSGGGYKQAVTFNWLGSNALCLSDSGGPVVIGPATGSGAVVMVGSMSWFGLGDILGATTYYRDEIMNVIRAAEGTGALEVGYDRPGSDFSSFVTASGQASECLAACTRNLSCRAFTFNSGVCWLKSAVPDWTPCPWCTSGIAPQREANSDRGGSDITPINVGSQPPEACIALCSKYTGCNAYAYVPPSGGSSAVCWLKWGVPNLSYSYGQTSGVRRGLEFDTDRWGADYQEMDVLNTPHACASLCQKDVNCRAFTFKPGGPTGIPSAHCWLKSAVPGPSTRVGLVSGVKRGLEQNTDRNGGDLIDYYLTDKHVPQACQALCAQNSRCQAFTYVPPGLSNSPRARCWLKSIVPGASYSPGLVSGVRGADFF